MVTTYLFDDYEIDSIKSELIADGEPVKLEPQVMSILEMLVSNAGRIVRREELIEKVWDGRITSNAVIDSRIRAARAAIGDNGKDQDYIKTYPNKGYKFVKEVSVASCSDGSAPNPESARSKSSGAGISPVLSAGLGAIACVIVLSVTALIGSSLTSQVVPAQQDRRQADSSSIAHTVQELVVGIPGVEVLMDSEPSIVMSSKYLRQQIAGNLSAISGVRAALLDTTGAENKPSHILRLSLLEGSEDAILNVVLVQTSDSTVLWSKTYSEPDLSGRPDDSRLPLAREVSLLIINRLGYSAGLIDEGFGPFEVYSETRRGLELLRDGGESNTQAARRIFEEQIKLEPQFVPAHAGLFHSYWNELHFAGVAYDDVIQQLRDVYAGMREIAPQAPETLTAQASLLGIETNSLDVETVSIVELLEEALQRAPHYFPAQETLAWTYTFRGQFEKSIILFEKALESHPSDPGLLGGKSHALSCVGRFDEAWAITSANLRWNPTDPGSLSEAVLLALQSGQYATARSIVDNHFRKEGLGYGPSLAATEWYLTIGDYDTAEHFAYEAPGRSYVQALKGQSEQAKASASEMIGYYLSAFALQILGNDDPMLKRTLVVAAEATDKFYQENSVLSPCDLSSAVHEAYVLQKHEMPIADVVVRNLQRYYSNHELADFRLLDQYIGLAGLNVLVGDNAEAVRVLRAAHNNGFVFVHHLQDPIFSNLQSIEDFNLLAEEMRSVAPLVGLPA